MLRNIEPDGPTRFHPVAKLDVADDEPNGEQSDEDDEGKQPQIEEENKEAVPNLQ